MRRGRVGIENAGSVGNSTAQQYRGQGIGQGGGTVGQYDFGNGRVSRCVSQPFDKRRQRRPLFGIGAYDRDAQSSIYNLSTRSPAAR